MPGDKGDWGRKWLVNPWVSRKIPLVWSAVILFLGILVFLPAPRLPDLYATVLESHDGELLGARIAPDGQWRFPLPDSVPVKFKVCLLSFEDRYFYRHPGVNPMSLARALVLNIRAGRIVSGGSTLTMQLARLARPGRARTLISKTREIFWAFNLELRYSKEEILRRYAGHAPFGSNTVGLEAASWRYFRRPPHLLSWGEAAALAVLPNAPSLIYPGKNDSLLLAKRNRLLKLLCRRNLIDTMTLELSMEEPLPGNIYPVPLNGLHLLDQAVKETPGTRVRTTLDFSLQQQVNQMVLRHAGNLQSNHIFNACALIATVKEGRVLAYTGNVPGMEGGEHGGYVDVIRAPRSSGSILKPFLYAALLEKGLMAPHQLVPDIPLRIDGFTPVNFSHDYDGAVPASRALARSLNVPAVKMLQWYGVEAFYHFLEKAGMTTLTKPAGHYGLSLILGGAETKLWDLAGMYASMARIVRTYEEKDGFYPVTQFRPLVWRNDAEKEQDTEASRPFLRAAAVYQTLEALMSVNRPEEETGWETFAGLSNIAWKTGTSFGFRDGWAVGMTRDYVVAVWAGNCDGEGRPGLTGTVAAAPLMFEIFGLFPPGNRFAKPVDELVPMTFCNASGFLASPFCTEKDTLLVAQGSQPETCPYHQFIHLDKTLQYRVSGSCYPVADLQTASWFVLPPAIEYYYRRKHPGYAMLPPVREGCQTDEAVMEFIYPRETNHLFIPRQLGNHPGVVIFEVAHRQPEAEVFWYIDDRYAGKTVLFHQMSLAPEPGWHLLTLTDREGNQITKRFHVSQSR